MKSGHHYKRTGLLIVATMVAGFVIGPASAQQQDQRQIKLLNVNPDTGMVEAGKELAIPLQVNSGAPTLEVDAEGNINAYCHPNGSDGNGRCLPLGTGGGGDVSAPTITNLQPSATVPASNTTERLRWDTNAQFCYGVGSNPHVTGWANLIQTSNGFTVGNLPRNAAGQANKNYDFTLGCYSAPQQGVPTAVGYTQVTHRVTLAPVEAGTPPDPDPPTGDFCNAYKDTSYNGVKPKDAPGFQPTELHKIEGNFASLWGISVENIMINGGTPQAFPPQHAARQLNYYTVPLAIPNSSSVTNKGIKFSWYEPQELGMTGVVMEVNISPCPGDFRKASNNPYDADVWLRSTCRKHAAINGPTISTTTGGASGDFGVLCQLKKGTTMYLNIGTYTTEPMWANPPQALTADHDRCQNEAICALRMIARGITSQYN